MRSLNYIYDIIVAMSLDKIFENRIKSILGGEYDDFEKALEKEPVKAIRLNALKCDKSGKAGTEGSDTDSLRSDKDFENYAKEILDKSGAKLLENIAWELNGFSYEGGTPGKHPYHEAGVYYIQEPSAMSPVAYLDTKPGEKILDLCAAPGGKSTQIASRMMGEGILVTNEIDKKRAQILSLNIERCGIRNALVTNMKPEQLSEVFEGYFDKILVDAPCSGEGMFRKNDEAISNWSTMNVRLCASRQTDILKEAVKMLAPGGKLVYSTCTFAPEEDELQAARLLKMGMKPVEIKLFEGMIPGNIENIQNVFKTTNEGAGNTELNDNDLYDLINRELSDTDENISLNEIDERIRTCTARLWPHKIKGEGHFLAAFTKEGDISLNAGLYGVNGKVKAVKQGDVDAFEDFAESFLKNVQIVDEADMAADASNASEVAETAAKKQKGKDQNKANKKNKKGSKGALKLTGSLKGTLFMFGDQLYLAPEGMPGINGLTVMRPGLHLGTMKKDRFEPSHSLALTLSAADVTCSYDLDSDSQEAMKFIGGESLRVPGLSNGWHLITTDGFSLGWAKYAGGTLKNHYPKGLRIYT
jgi:16S rRNA C967 or C1407 C5-methylase (RsmB/RsmF family)/NOL1/NOP2/fmu family ribosome biogenesis protein